MNETIEKIELDENKLTSYTLKKLGISLKLNKTLRYLGLEGNFFDKDPQKKCLEEFLNSLKFNTSLLYLNLANTKIKDEYLGLIDKLLDKNHSIILIDLTRNKL